MKYWSVSFSVPIENLDKGDYKFFVEGQAGQDAEHKCRSIEGKFEIE